MGGYDCLLLSFLSYSTLRVSKSQGITPKEQTFNTGIAACKLREGLSGPELLRSMDKVVEIITSRGGAPSENIQLRLAVACTHANVSDRAATLFERAVRGYEPRQ